LQHGSLPSAPLSEQRLATTSRAKSNNNRRDFRHAR
jgi:hypothetical protein